MPELPEVETTRRGITSAVTQQTIQQVIVREHRLRWAIPTHLPRTLRHLTIEQLSRRAKYLLFHTQKGTLILHLGMSGHLRLLNRPQPAGKHDHVDFIFTDTTLRYNDPRRFGSIHWTTLPAEEHKLLAPLGPEPLSTNFNGAYLHQLSRKKTVSIKSFIMNSKIVVGVGNIYASESLFRAGINPKRPAGRISLTRFNRLTTEIQSVLRSAIKAGGTTLKDFSAADGTPGYFQQVLNVYGREGEPCHQCHRPIKRITQTQRSTFYCPHCQT